MHIKAILPSRMTRFRCAHAIMFALACWAAPVSAQYGTPEEWRRGAPTIADRDPGIAVPADADMDTAYRRRQAASGS
jgi:hypothetical protein